MIVTGRAWELAVLPPGPTFTNLNLIYNKYAENVWRQLPGTCVPAGTWHIRWETNMETVINEHGAERGYSDMHAIQESTSLRSLFVGLPLASKGWPHLARNVTHTQSLRCLGVLSN
jgi:hypothetical protein